MPHAPASIPIHTWSGERLDARRDTLAAEEPLEIRVRNRPISVTMRTPGHEDELAAGFLLGEGLIRSRSDVLEIAPCERHDHGNSINVRPAPMVSIDPSRLTRNTFMSASCGICGKASIDAVRARVTGIEATFRISSALLCSLPAQMREAQGAFAESGGLHGAAIFTATGSLLVVREDVGRHNAVDKTVGRLFLDGAVPLSAHILLVSGRASFEIMQKAAMAGIGLVAAVSAPSSLAVQFAEEVGLTLVGFLRPPRFNVYSRPDRIEP